MQTAYITNFLNYKFGFFSNSFYRVPFFLEEYLLLKAWKENFQKLCSSEIVPNDNYANKQISITLDITNLIKQMYCS